ncbi:MAG: glutamate--tRNA ligase family protein [Verrucomicrobia bacterium]|nr:glutamate--tRNA ligase family protein [Verrucomicrobiota bacterium]
MSKVRVRFAPSPTGLLHIGGARTALFNWLYARHTGGTFILRVEDTDQSRNTLEAEAVIFRGMRWLGLDWDEGPDGKGGVMGDRGPYFQSQRGSIYAKYLEKLQATGKTYEDGGALKFRMPKTPGVVKDLVCGDVTFDRTMEPDLVIRRKDGSPVFHLVNVVDDLEMGITHVIRGEDHLTNTHKHIALYEALGAVPPQFAHIPLILNRGRSKMSKRDDGAAVEFYEEAGYLPAAVRNYLCLLGWSLGENQEILPIDEIIQKFDLQRLHRSNASFDADKLFWINGEYWRALSDGDFEKFTREYLARVRPAAAALDPALRNGLLKIMREKVRTGRELAEWLDPYLTEEYEYSPESRKKQFSNPDAGKLLIALEAGLMAIQGPLDEAGAESVCQKVAEAAALKPAKVIHLVRAAVSGRTVGPSLFALLVVLGMDRVKARLARTRELLEAGQLGVVA